MPKTIVELTNPQKLLEVEDWPVTNRRGLARFKVYPLPGIAREQIVRTLAGNRHRSPVGSKVRVCEGSDGRTWIIGRHKPGIYFMQPGTMRMDLIEWFNEDEPQAQIIARVLADAV